MKHTLWLAALAVVLGAGSASAQQNSSNAQTSVTGTGANRNQNMIFTDELVSTQLLRPDDHVIRHLRRSTGDTLIRWRTDFVEEMNKSVEHL